MDRRTMRFKVGISALILCCWGCASVAHRADGQAVDKVPSDQAMRAFELRMDGKTDEAKVLLEKACKRSPKDACLWFELARVHWHQWSRERDMKPAQKAIDRAVKLEPDNVRYLYYAGQIHFYHGFIKAHNPLLALSLPLEMGKAKKSLEKALVLDPNEHQARLFLMKLYSCPAPLGSKRKAAKHLNQLEALDPVYAIRAKEEQGSSHDPEARLAIWKSMLQSHPDHPEVHAALCKAYARVKDYEKAMQHFERACQLDPWQQRLLLDIASSCGKNRTQKEAYLWQYLASEPAPPKAMQALVWGQRYWSFKRQGKLEEAEQALTRANALDPDGHAGPELIRDMFVAP